MDLEKNKIPIWENYGRYRNDLDFIVGSLIAVSDRDYQLRVWYRSEGPEVDWRTESALSFDPQIAWFKKIVRDGTIQLSPAQIKGILRVNVMWSRFNRMMLNDPNCPEDELATELYKINHPYWEKVRKQAQYALSLIQKH
jgi:hypothetical protein